MTRTFRYDFDPKLAPFWLPFGVRPWHDSVTITDDDHFEAQFGFVSIETPMKNVVDAHVTRGYRWWTAAGVRMSGADDGLTFGTNARAGVCVHFAEKVPSTFRRSGHSALTVTVADVDGLKERLAADRGSD